MFKIKEDYKIPFIERTIPKGTIVRVVGSFDEGKDDEKAKVKVVGIAKNSIKTKKVCPGDVYAIEENLLETYNN